jgi:uncharacterized protein YkwD
MASQDPDSHTNPTAGQVAQVAGDKTVYGDEIHGANIAGDQTTTGPITASTGILAGPPLP